ncbi:ADP-dependent NAD(P)H-hydrate dehydratase, partial [Mycobacterium tuberculosis]|uniref:ADP-dependent NAD(P)H-hydrate dehydratase n=1 Tax=Mycobacterium tuberculosis TaxID=1773 RepID=UPI000AA12E6A
VPGVAIRATRTISFGLAQPGLYCYPGAAYAGEVVVNGIGFPPALLDNSSLILEMLDDRQAGQWLPSRPATAHKGSAGHLLVIGGAPGMTGAPVLTALGALRSGCGLVTIGAREPGLLTGKPVEVMTAIWTEALARPDRYKGAVFGPGLSVAADGRQFLLELLKIAQWPLVIDADGLNLLGENPEWLATS